MKTTLQQAIERVKEYRDMGSADADTCNTILLHLASLLPQEKQQIIDAYYEGRGDESEGFPMEIADDYYNETYKP